jgi:hypothetical protein
LKSSVFTVQIILKIRFRGTQERINPVSIILKGKNCLETRTIWNSNGVLERIKFGFQGITIYTYIYVYGRYNSTQIHFEWNSGSSKKFFSFYKYIRSFLPYYYYLSFPAVVPKHVWAAAEPATVPTIHLAGEEVKDVIGKVKQSL